MNPGVYIKHPDLGTRMIASLDEVRLGNEEVVRDIGNQLIGYLADSVVDFVTNSNSSATTAFIIFLVQ